MDNFLFIKFIKLTQNKKLLLSNSNLNNIIPNKLLFNRKMFKSNVNYFSQKTDFDNFENDLLTKRNPYII